MVGKQSSRIMTEKAVSATWVNRLRREESWTGEQRGTPSSVVTVQRGSKDG
jgi:hypothetical protein